MNSKTKFYRYMLDHFVGQTLQTNMARTVENSPWHREADVWVHTNMVLGEFEHIQIKESFNDRAATVGRFALLFHDVGKPQARTQKESPERGVYFSYPGHEQMSAREMEEYFGENQMLLTDIFDFSIYDAYATAWLIEYHLPYDTKKAQKRSNMASSVKSIEDTLEAPGLFAAVLRSDARGRISDDTREKLQKVEGWITDFYALPEFN